MRNLPQSYNSKFFAHIPADWKLVELKKLVKADKKITYGIVQPGKYEENGVLLIRGQDYMTGWVDKAKFFRVAPSLHQKFKRSTTTSGDVLLSIAGYTGTVAIVPSWIVEANLTQTTARISCNQELLHGRYLSYFLQSNDGLLQSKRYTKGSAQEGLNLEDIEKFFVSLPPLPEQQKIATILSSVDDVIEKTRAQIDKLKDLKTGMMQELLTKGIGHTEFKDSPVGRIPTEWDVVSLGELIGAMEGGVSVNGENRQKNPSEIGVLKVSSVFKGKFFPDEHKAVIEIDVSRARLNPIKDRILFSRANTPKLVGESAYIDKTYTDLFLPDKIWMIDVKDRQRTYVKWLSYVLCSGHVRSTISEVATGTSSSMKNISKPSLLCIQTAIPRIEEQIKIAESLQSVDDRLSCSRQKLIQLLSIKKALMQDLLTGKVRVKLTDKESAAS